MFVVDTRVPAHRRTGATAPEKLSCSCIRDAECHGNEYAERRTPLTVIEMAVEKKRKEKGEGRKKEKKMGGKKKGKKKFHIQSAEWAPRYSKRLYERDFISRENTANTARA